MRFFLDIIDDKCGPDGVWGLFHGFNNISECDTEDGSEGGVFAAIVGENL